MSRDRWEILVVKRKVAINDELFLELKKAVSEDWDFIEVVQRETWSVTEIVNSNYTN